MGEKILYRRDASGWQLVSSGWHPLGTHPAPRDEYFCMLLFLVDSLIHGLYAQQILDHYVDQKWLRKHPELDHFLDISSKIGNFLQHFWTMKYS